MVDDFWKQQLVQINKRIKRLIHRFKQLICIHDWTCIRTREFGYQTFRLCKCKICGKEAWID